VEISPGMKQFLPQITLTQKKGFGRFNLAIYWKRKYKDKQEESPWYLLTNLRQPSINIFDEYLVIYIRAGFYYCYSY
jgi:hypothetical protein